MSGPDDIEPGQVTGFTAVTGLQVELNWTSPGDDGYSGNVTNGMWQINYSSTVSVGETTGPETAEYIVQLSSSWSQGTTTFASTITGLKPRTTYYFWISASDENDNWSVWSDTQTAISGTYIDISADVGIGDSYNLAFGDYNNDGYLDLAVGNYNQTNYIYQNNGNGTFTDISASIGAGNTISIAWGDYDNDGDLDLAVGNSNETNYIYRNDGGGTFNNISASIGTGNTYSVAWGDYDNDGDLDLAVGNSTNETNYIFRNDGSGIFTDISASIGVGNTESIVWGDYDNDGDLDLAVGNHQDQTNYIYRNEGGEIFTNISAAIGSGNTQSVSWGDYDNDGDLDLAVGNYGQTNYIYRNDGSGLFTDISASIGAEDTCSVSWGDYDNDGDLDLVGGNSTNQNNYIYSNEGNDTFTNVSVFIDTGSTSSVFWGDYDNDGDIDLAVGNYDNQINYIYKSLEADFGNTNTEPTETSGSTVTYNVASGMLEFRWNKATDAETAQDGLYYSVNITTDITYGKYILWDEVILGNKHSAADFGNYMHSYTSSTLQPGLNFKPVLFNTTYYWHVHTLDTQMRASSWTSDELFYLPELPDIPTVFTGLAQSTDVIKWSWTDNADNEDGYQVISDTGGVLYDSLAADATYWLETGLSVNTSYYRYTTAYNITGSSSSAVNNTYTLANPATGTYVVSVSSYYISLEWEANNNPVYTSWGVLRSTDNFAASTTTLTVFIDTYTTTSYYDDTILPSTTYWYTIKAFNGEGKETAYDAIVTTVTLSEIAVSTYGYISGIVTDKGASAIEGAVINALQAGVVISSTTS
ncbi:FG-GAP-like repeat-containing protein, partial [Elusimicrobiota bacterium]